MKKPPAIINLPTTSIQHDNQKGKYLINLFSLYFGELWSLAQDFCSSFLTSDVV